MGSETLLSIDVNAATLERLAGACAPTRVLAVTSTQVTAEVQREQPLALIIDLSRTPSPVPLWLQLSNGVTVVPVVLWVPTGHEAALGPWVAAGARHWVHQGREAEWPLVLSLVRLELANEQAVTAQRERAHQSTAALVRLARSPRVTGSDVEAAIREVTRAAARGLQATRAGVWLLDERRELLRLVDRYDARDDQHITTDPPLAPHPEYLKVMRAQRIVAVADSQTDRRTREFSEGYFGPADVRSNLDVTLRLRGELMGVLSVEQIGRRREWAAEDEVFAGVLGDVVSLALESAERFRAEAALRKSERRLSDIFKFTNDSIVLYRVALDGSVFCEDINPAGEATTGVLRDEAIGLRPQDVLPAIDETLVKQQFQQCITTRMATQLETQLSLPEGQRTVSTALVPLLDEAGNVERIAAVSRDMTDVRTAEQARRRLELQIAELHKNEALARLATHLAADMSETLTRIATHLVHAGEALTEPAREALLQSTREGLQLTQDALTYARRRVPEKNRINLVSLVHGVVAREQASLAPQVTVQPGVPALWVLGDEQQLQQAIAALIRHAAVVAPVSTPVKVALLVKPVTAALAAEKPPLVEGSYVKVRVVFAGPVLSDEERQRYFEPFFARTSVSSAPDTGLALAVAQTLVAAHDGAIFVESSQATGSVFQVFVPQAPEVSPSVSYRLMLVDDHPGMARVSARLLETLGYRTTVFDNPHEALAVFGKDPQAFDAVLTDLSMPQMSGEQFTQALHQVRPELPVIVSSGRAGDLDAKALSSLGVAGVLVKPWRIDEAVATLNRALRPAAG